MLADISIENLGVIERASAELSSGLTVLTGETGAGKTMVVTGLRLLAGNRADASRVRQGADKAAVEGRFIIDELESREEVIQLVESVGGMADENGEYIASRTVSAAGRSKAYLGGRAVPAATLGEFAEKILTVHGQNDQLRLLAPDQQLLAVDRSDHKVGPLLEDYAVAFRHWRTLAKDYAHRTQSRRELAQEVDRLQYAVAEIDDIAPEPGEDAGLVELIRRLQDVDGLREQASSALGAIDGEDSFGESSAAALLGQARSQLAGAEDPKLSALGEQLGDITARLSDIAGELGQFLDGLPADPNQLEKSLQRQQELKALTRKYAPDIDGVLKWREDAAARLSSIDTSGEALEELKRQVMEAEAEMIAKAKALTLARKRAAAALSTAVTRELAGLAMGASALEAQVRTAKYSRTGADEVELMLNGRPLASSASGGELSRVMLALEVVLAANTSGTTMVFDEVDAGVGGRAAVEIGRRLARLALNNQVIVVTHLPQVAAFANAHIHVAKELATSGVSNLTPEQRVEELARMLAGLDGSETGRAHAQELYDRAQEEVGRLRAPNPL
ncbi:DNA recombination protein RecN [Corynebacterium phocae]|uniref:DNA repair protein RecN n=1 Tax=Corynebacterium phocae TaxID=161895 RepID=A0A1L7D397_9CORY|nr:DNA repair protein RecN [Corynebacterium phocae]APT92575.1 DNA recombination protein RecN [Corynebacterium phocae]KAA8725175.1 DNA repair protein RecN [Corynebacterium phocae]